MANEMTTMMTQSPEWGHTMKEKKYVYREDDGKEYATKGVGGTALGIGIGALALTLLNRNGGLGNILGNGTDTRIEDLQRYNAEIFSLYKGYRDADDAIIAKHNEDSFSLYQNTVNSTSALQKEIDDLKTRIAVTEAVEPWKFKEVYSAIALERERRECADCGIVNYSNNTFYPQSIADVTVGTTSTQKTIFNPLSCMNNCGCGCR